MCAIIGEFIENNNLHRDTEKLVNIIMKFDDNMQHFVKALVVPSNKIEIQEFWSKMLYRIRYIFSKLGRLLNLHEQSKEWLIKDNARLLKSITKTNPNFQKLIKAKKIALINMDSHLNKNAKMSLYLMYRKVVAGWKQEVDYAMFLRREDPYIWWRICNNEILASIAEHHTKLCRKRYDVKMKTSEIDKKLMEISHRITNEISNLTKAKVSSAILRKRSVFESPNPNKNIFIFPTPSLTSKTVTTQDKINEKDSSNTAKWMFQMKIPEKNM
jgi:hypothetical protein